MASALAPFRLARRLLQPVVDFALPPRCPGCGAIVAVDHSFCIGCWQALDFLGGPACEICAEPLALAFHPGSQCAACIAAPPPFARLRAAVAYGPIARALALKLKHGRRTGIAETMARPIARAGAELLAGALVTPVPLHRWRIWSRGYNQAALIARAVIRAGGSGELALDLLQRRRATPMLRGLGRRGRARAVAGVFAVDPRHRALIRGRCIVLIDDVYTTGATAQACARALRRAGAAQVSVLCWARVVRDDAIAR